MPKRKKPAKKAEPKDSAGISKPSLAIEIDPDFLAQLRKLPKPVRRRVGLAIEGVRAHWGKPHHHGGSEFADWRPIFMNHASASKNVSFFRVLKLASIFTSWEAMTKYKSFCDPIFDS